MKRRLKLAASLVLVTGVALGIAVSYSDQAVDNSMTKLDGCPVYQGGSDLRNQVGVDWARAVNIGDRIAQPAGGTMFRRNYIDDFIFDAMADDPENPGQPIPHAQLCTDSEFIRRAYLDLTGKIPPIDEVRAFLTDSSATKREDLVDRLMATTDFEDRMVMFFGDHFQITYGTNPTILTTGRDVYSNYFRTFIRENRTLNRPYSSVAVDLINATTSSITTSAAGATANFYLRPWDTMGVRYDTIDNIAADVGRAFLGQTFMCVTCHNGRNHLESVNLYLSRKTRAELWNMAAFFSALTYTTPRGSTTFNQTPTNGYNVRDTGAQGGVRPTRSPIAGQDLFPPIFKFDRDNPDGMAGADYREWRADLSTLVVKDRQFARNFVNLMWRLYMGVGLVEGTDSFDQARLDPNDPPPAPWGIQPTNPALLEALADDFIGNDYDMKKTIRDIVTSGAYQLSAEFPEGVEWEGRYAQYHARHFARRMEAESMLDAITQFTKEGPIPITTRGSVMKNWAMQLQDPTEPQPNIGDNAAIRSFLNNFFRGSREGKPRSIEGSVQQVLDLTNNRTLVINRVMITGGIGRRVQNFTTDEEIVDELFLAALSRYPSPEEKSQALQRFGPDRARATENLILALINKLDFIHY